MYPNFIFHMHIILQKILVTWFFFMNQFSQQGSELVISRSRISRWRVAGRRGHPDGKRARIIPWIHNPDANSRHACLDLNGRDISRIILRIFALFFTVSPEIPSVVRVTVFSFWDLNPFAPTLFLNVKNDAILFPILFQRCIYSQCRIDSIFYFLKVLNCLNLSYIQVIHIKSLKKIIWINREMFIKINSISEDSVTILGVLSFLSGSCSLFLSKKSYIRSTFLWQLSYSRLCDATRLIDKNQALKGVAGRRCKYR